MPVGQPAMEIVVSQPQPQHSQMEAEYRGFLKISISDFVHSVSG